MAKNTTGAHSSNCTLTWKTLKCDSVTSSQGPQQHHTSSSPSSSPHYIRPTHQLTLTLSSLTTEPAPLTQHHPHRVRDTTIKTSHSSRNKLSGKKTLEHLFPTRPHNTPLKTLKNYALQNHRVSNTTLLPHRLPQTLLRTLTDSHTRTHRLSQRPSQTL